MCARKIAFAKERRKCSPFLEFALMELEIGQRLIKLSGTHMFG